MRERSWWGWGWARSDDEARAPHTHGKAYRDVIRNLRGDLVHPPDFVWFPHDVEEVERPWRSDCARTV